MRHTDVDAKNSPLEDTGRCGLQGKSEGRTCPWHSRLTASGSHPANPAADLQHLGGWSGNSFQ